MKEAGHTVEMIRNAKGKTIVRKNGEAIQADEGIDDVNADHSDTLLISGGFFLG